MQHRPPGGLRPGPAAYLRILDICPYSTPDTGGFSSRFPWPLRVCYPLVSVRVTVTSLPRSRSQELLGVLVELPLAAGRAKVVCLPLVLALRRRCRRIDLHLADRIDCLSQPIHLLFLRIARTYLTRDYPAALPTRTTTCTTHLHHHLHHPPALRTCTTHLHHPSSGIGASTSGRPPDASSGYEPATCRNPTLHNRPNCKRRA